MDETSRQINQKLNELLSKPSSARTGALDAQTAVSLATTLRVKILGSDKQEKVNSIVVLAKLLECVSGADVHSADFCPILDEALFGLLLSIVSAKMSTDTYKAILKIMLLTINGGPFPPAMRKASIEPYLPLYLSLVEHLDAIDVMTARLYLSDSKILLPSIRLVTELINKSLSFNYDKIITLAGRLKHDKFFSTAGNLIEPSDSNVVKAIENLESAYYRLNEYLSKTLFDMQLESHQIMLINLFIFLDVSLNEYATPATSDEYVKAGFTAEPKKFVVENFSILLAMDLKVFLKDPNMTFKKRFHEELMMSDHNRTFPLYLFIDKCTEIWLDTFHRKSVFPEISKHILSWELMIYHSMDNCLRLWQNTRSQLENPRDIEGIIKLLQTNIKLLEGSLLLGLSIDESLESFAERTSDDIRFYQFSEMKSKHKNNWNSIFHGFDTTLKEQTLEFVREQRVMQLLKGAWVHTESHALQLFQNRPKKPNTGNYYFLILSPNRRALHYKEYDEIPARKPTFEEMESQSILLNSIENFKSTKIGKSVGERDKARNKALISIKGTMSYEEIRLTNKQDQTLLSFYTDSEDNKAVWLDGLKMLKGLTQEEHLSVETTQHIKSLQEIRKNTQLLILESEDFADCAPKNSEVVDDAEFYDLNELEEILRDFHYM
ncbi:hypothetical protein PUMCH_004945 [Australozyma saopauloensis]|uniref:PH domain-containing protein n=1 Tax=Australozyma saopauloensis TaxID=291208 RepID=A0AAX4HHK6_9ASCO|nr:hypothetical protein PUMCH_004945 [[Candida] saopauloensis]